MEKKRGYRQGAQEEQGVEVGPVINQTLLLERQVGKTEVFVRANGDLGCRRREMLTFKFRVRIRRCVLYCT